MPRALIVCVLLVIFAFGLVASAAPVAAQNAAVKCGDIIKGELTKEKQVQSYPIVLSPGDKVTFAGQADGTSQLLFGITLDSPAGYRIFPDRNAYIDMVSSPFLVTGRMPAYGLYTLYVFNNDKTGSYQIGIGCELADGTIIPAGDTSYTPTNTGRPKTVTLPLAVIQGSSLKQLQCGDVVVAEFTQNEQIHSYLLEMAAGDISFQLGITPFGDGFYTAAVVIDTSGEVVAGSELYYVKPGLQLNVNPVSTGNYRISISNTALNKQGTVHYPGDWGYRGGVGIYTLVVNCTLKGNVVVAPDPAKIEQAAALEPAAQTAGSAPAVAANAPVDASQFIKIPLVAGVAMTGAVTATGTEAFGFTLDAAAGDTLDLDVSRVSGNLNLGLVVLSADNKVVFQASLVTSQTLATRLTLPSAGQYTIGVFRVDLLPPDAPEATAFQVQGTLNPQ